MRFSQRTERSQGPLVLDIKGNALDDGPGIRSVVFMKGCPLDCLWCHNPESKDPLMQLSFDGEKCVGCGDCAGACSEGAITGASGQSLDRSLCSLCLACTQVCPSRALEPVGKAMTVDEVVEAVIKDHPFFEASGGGVTLSGGEPLFHLSFCSELLKAFQARNIHTLVETCGHFNWSRFERDVLPHVDTVYCDIKLMDPHQHLRYCGVTNQLVLENLKRLLALSREGALELLPRIPLIPGLTARRSNIEGIASFLMAHGGETVQVMPYNPLWVDKCRKIGGELPLKRLSEREGLGRFMEKAEIECVTEILEASGLAVV
ncbi:MAG: glycyl-radical enzyme activating protein [Desulfobacterales bacterium]|nr:glycyl-radical enzyme activating protein [Desulfobacterales bacterium]